MLAAHWYRFMHDLLAEISIAYRESGLMEQDIAARLGQETGFIRSCIHGDQMMTVRTMNNIARAMGYRLKVSVENLSEIKAPGDDP